MVTEAIGEEKDPAAHQALEAVAGVLQERGGEAMTGLKWFRGAIVVATVFLASCTHAPYGGEKETALITATAAHDVAKVQALLDSGANPNAMVKYEEGCTSLPGASCSSRFGPSTRRTS